MPSFQLLLQAHHWFKNYMGTIIEIKILNTSFVFCEFFYMDIFFAQISFHQRIFLLCIYIYGRMFYEFTEWLPFYCACDIIYFVCQNNTVSNQYSFISNQYYYYLKISIASLRDWRFLNSSHKLVYYEVFIYPMYALFIAIRNLITYIV